MERLQLWRELFATGRPTTGAYAFVLTLVGYKYGDTAWTERLLFALGFAGLTMSIMAFNDWKDRHNDRRKGKLFASEHAGALLRYWLGLNAITALVLALAISFDAWTVGFCAVVWALGIFYSFVPHWYIVQNVIVALCAGSPVLCAAITNRSASRQQFITFLLFFSLIFMGEIHKDIEDADTDIGYKQTIPVKMGKGAAALTLLGMWLAPAILCLAQGNQLLKYVAMVMLPWLQYWQLHLLIYHHIHYREWIGKTKAVMRTTLKVALITLLFA